MASPVLDLSGYSSDEQQSLLIAAKSEYLVRITGRVQQGSSAAQSYGMQFMTVDDLVRLINALTQSLGFADAENRVRPNFNGCSVNNGVPFA